MTNRENFLNLVAAVNVPVLNPVQRGSNIFHTGMSIPRGDAPKGMENHPGAAFINIPVKAKISHGEGIDIDEEDSVLMVYQRYLDDDDLFTVYCEVSPIGRENFLMDDHGDHDFSLLKKLLSGETLKFHEKIYRDDVATDDPEVWAEITLNR